METSETRESEDVWKSVNQFSEWLESHGYDSYDPYDVWGTAYGRFSRRLYYRRSLVGLPFIAPILFLETLCPQWRGLFVKKTRYATADAQLLTAFLNLYEITSKREYLVKAVGLADDLVATSVPGYSGYCWGYPFDWQHVNGLSPRGTPFITTTPYCFEAFLQLWEATGEAKYLDWASSTARFVGRDLKDYPTGNGAASSGYCPFHRSTVINAAAYRAMVLFEAGHRFELAEYSDKAEGNLKFILQSQRTDGSWLYSADNPKEAFIDHFHTCFVLKNLWKLNRRLKRPEVVASIRNGYRYYREALYDEEGLPRSFALKPRAQIVRLEFYNFAEAITLGCLLKSLVPEAFEMSLKLAKLVCCRYQSSKGYFATRVYRGGLRHNLPFLRWPQAQLFYSLTNVLKAVERGKASVALANLEAKT